MQVCAGLPWQEGGHTITSIALADPISSVSPLVDARLPAKPTMDPIATPSNAQHQLAVACCCAAGVAVWREDGSICSWDVAGEREHVPRVPHPPMPQLSSPVVAVGWHKGRVLTLHAGSCYVTVWELSGVALEAEPSS
jgi:hypothetical protein